MLAEKAAGLIRSREPLAPLDVPVHIAPNWKDRAEVIRAGWLGHGLAQSALQGWNVADGHRTYVYDTLNR
jgi:hypothetical protein